MESLAWSSVFAEPGKEFTMSKLEILEGTVPKNLNGALYRNGPGRLERGGEKYTHWFDGDGAILGLWFNNGEANGMYKYVQTEGYVEEEKEGKFIYRGFDYMPGGFFSQVFGKRKSKNAANTSVLPLPDKLLALWEGGAPHSLKLDNLDTIGLDDLGFIKEDGMTYSAHPKVDPNGDIFNIGLINGAKQRLCVYHQEKSGKIIRQCRIKLDLPNMIHDFCLAGDYIVVFNYATNISLTKLVLGINTFHQALYWDPDLGTEIFIIEKSSLKLLHRFKIKDAFYVFHFVNGYTETDGTIYIEFVKYKDFPSIDFFLQNIPNDLDKVKEYDAEGFGRLNFMRLDPKKGEMLEFKEINSVGGEFPTVADALVGKKWRYTLMACYPSGKDNKGQFFRAIGRHDRETNKMEEFFLGDKKYCGEPILVSGDRDPEEGHVLTVVYDAEKKQSELWIHLAESLSKGPVCRLKIPSLIPFGFHGRYKYN